MSSGTFARQVIDSVLPGGSLWKIAPDSDEDHFIDGAADNWQAQINRLELTAFLRDPMLTTELDDLEREFGLTPNLDLPDALRRKILANRKYRRKPGTIAELQYQLDLAGFGNGGYGLQVFDNNGLANPEPFAHIVPQVECGQDWAICGNNLAYCGFRGNSGLLIVNGSISISSPNWWGCGMTAMCAGADVAMCGYYTDSTTISTTYPIPADPGYWGLFFFLGKNPTYDGNGKILTIQNVQIPWTRQTELIELVCRYKPIETWGVACIDWT